MDDADRADREGIADVRRDHETEERLKARYVV